MNGINKTEFYDICKSVYATIKSGKPKKITGYISAFIFICISIYTVCFLIDDKDNIYNAEGLIIFIFSLIIVTFAIKSISNNGIKAYNLFFGIYFVFLMINTFNLSEWQQPKTLLDIYYYFFGSLLFGGLLYLGEKGFFTSKTKIIFGKFFNPDILAVSILALYYICNVYIFSRVGIRLFGSGSYNETGELYTVPGITSLVGVLFYILIPFIPHVNKINKCIIVGSLVVFAGILNVSRGDMLRVFIFLVLYYMFSKGKEIFNGKYFKRILIIGLTVIILFVLAGEFRQSKESYNFDINYSVDGKFNNKYVNWLFGYAPINFDVLKVTIDEEPTFVPNASLIAVYKLLGKNQNIQDYFDKFSKRSLGMFNASTFLSMYIDDFGVFYFVELILLGLFMGIMIDISKKYKITGIYIFLLLMIALTVFGNYIIFSFILFSVFCSLILLLFCDSRKSKFNNYG